MPDVFPTMALKLYAYGLQQLHDPNWTGMELFDRLKQHVRGRIEPKNLLRISLERGLSFYLGQWLYKDFFEVDRIEALSDEYRAWSLDDLVEMLIFHGCSEEEPALANAKSLVSEIDGKFIKNEKEYFNYLDSDLGIEEIVNAYQATISAHRERINELEAKYAEDFSDRMVHDRQLCFYVAELIIAIGFDGDDDDTGPKQWVVRERWPERVKTILKSRDRGKCSFCGANLTIELDAPIHIDHMVAIAEGGCNDIVNLQILCASCNRKKSKQRKSIPSSVPPYIKRGRA